MVRTPLPVSAESTATLERTSRSTLYHIVRILSPSFAHLLDVYYCSAFFSVHHQGLRPRYDPLLQTIQIHSTLATERQAPRKRYVTFPFFLLFIVFLNFFRRVP